MSDIHRLLPHDADAERGVISALMFWPMEAGNACAEMRLTPDDFHVPANSVIFRRLMEMWSENAGIDLITVTDQLRKLGELQEAGGVGYLTETATFIPTATMIRQHGEIVRQKATARRLYACCTRFAALAMEGGDTEVSELLLSAQNALAEIGTQKTAQGRSFKTILLETIDSIERGDDVTADIVSGIEAIDAIVRMRRGNMVVIGGEAKSGKTALAGTIVSHAAVMQERRVVVFSLEMSDIEMTKRALACAGRVNISMMGRQPALEDLDRVTRAGKALIATDLEIVSDAFELGAIVARCRQLHARKPLDLIVLDYLQLAEHSTGRKGETRQEIVAQISRTCKRLAGELNCVFIALSQLNEEGKLRESRAIGQDANAVLQVEVDAKGGRSLRVVAQRNGVSGVDVPVQWLPQYSRFEGK